MAQTRKLYRSRTDRKLAGVCGGLAQYLNADPTLIRVLFVVLALLGGPGLVIYLVLWILVPEEPQGTV
jgi:phage shock protein PspC (stress-responsive transcriptional regulator)